MQTIESGTFRMPSGRFAANLFILYGKAWCLLIISLFLSFLLLGIFSDIRWVICALLILFILTPLALAYLYFYHALRNVTCTNTVPHRLTISPQAITISVISIIEKEPGEKEEQTVSTRNVMSESVASISYGLDSILVRIKNPANEFIWLPLSAFRDSADFEQTIKTICSYPFYNDSKR